MQALSSQLTHKGRNVAFILLGAAALVLKPHYAGPLEAAVHAHGGNVAASFAVYFILSFVNLGTPFTRLRTAGLALLVVEAFELTDGFGLMANVYDPWDLAANVLGVALAVTVDGLAARLAASRVALFRRSS